MTVGDNVMYFNYDASGVPVSIVYNGTTYYYVTNLQGDIVGIVNQSGNKIVSYTYDAWGNILTTTGTSSTATLLAERNPLRYRGYVYDPETDLYYLQSRYYDPEMGRFINADALASTGQGLLGNNMFTYCGNNPIRYCDPCGTCIHNWIDTNCSACDAQIYVLGKMWDALSKSCSLTGEIGSGFGGKVKVGPATVDASIIIVGDEWTYNTDGTRDSARRGSITAEIELFRNISAGVDFEYAVPLEEGIENGLLGADGGKFDAVIGVYAFGQGIGYSTISNQDIELSLGFSGYFILGGGFEFSINLSQFWEHMREEGIS